ncbi:MAG: glutamate--tRNA ligase [Gemmatimonadetes bacterium]|nr:glutamate--tRNA ligase [Gemmatimonadota bacterium]
MTIRVRFAPSPTGYLHVGGARTALFNWLYARHHGGVFVLRIEDTDRDRSSPEHTEVILSALRWLGLDWDEGPFFQSDGADRHRAAALRLLEAGRAYRDFTTAEELAQAREAAKGEGTDLRLPRRRAEALPAGEAEERAEAGEAHAIRFLVPEGETVWEDMVHEEMRFQNAAIDDLVILRSDGSPTYNLAVTSDDAEQHITHVIRGDDHLSNTPKQILLSEALGYPVPTFGHVPMILGSDGKRLSKRHGATAVGEYESQGLLPGAMVNFLALLGWSPGGDLEVMIGEELIERFSMERVLKKSSIFDLKKLDWLCGQHFNASTAQALEPALTEGLEGAGLATRQELEERRDWYLSLIDLLKTRARTIPDLVDLARPFLVDELEFDPEAVTRYWLKEPAPVLEQLTALRARFETPKWEPEALEEVIRGYAEELSVGAGKVIHPLRVAVTGRAVSPGIFEVLALLGRDTVLVRLDEAIVRLDGR